MKGNLHLLYGTTCQLYWQRDSSTIATIDELSWIWWKTRLAYKYLANCCWFSSHPCQYNNRLVKSWRVFMESYYVDNGKFEITILTERFFYHGNGNMARIVRAIESWIRGLPILILESLDKKTLLTEWNVYFRLVDWQKHDFSSEWTGMNILIF